MINYLFGNCFTHAPGGEDDLSTFTGGNGRSNSSKARSSSTLFKVLMREDDTTTNMIITALGKTEDFKTLARIEGDAISKRDQEDGEKLQQGIDLAISKVLQ